ncbi:MAG: thymidine phosphorylase [Clostridia bacterium]
MRMVDLIDRKRRGGALDGMEIRQMIQGFCEGTIPDYQMSAFLMAVVFQGMTKEETSALTEAMADSGDIMDLSSVHGVKIDKHSSGGVGDKISLVLGPLVSAAGIPVAKMSGRGLGFTGGTIDKLESIPGFRTQLTQEEFLHNVNTIGIALAGQTGRLAPADKKLYALRDVTATVESLPLIASSIMSKKLAAGCDGIVLDVKAGSGAFMKTVDGARQLAMEMVSIGKSAGKAMTAVISDMSQPLGYAIGNRLEVVEAIEVLQGKGPKDVRQLTLRLGAYMLVLGRGAATPEEGEAILEELLDSGKGMEQFERFVRAQGGDLSRIGDTVMESKEVTLKPGVVQAMDTERIGAAAMCLGAGRKTKDDPIEYGAGLRIHKKIGDRLAEGEAAAILYYSHGADVEAAENLVRQAYWERPLCIALIHDIIA